MEEGLLEQKKGATNPTSSSDLQNTKTQLSCDSRRQCPSCNTVFRVPPPKPQLSIHFRNSTDRMRTALSSNLSACKDTRHKTHLQRHKDSTRNSSSCRTDRVFFGGEGGKDADFPINTTHKPQAIHCRDDTCLQTFSPLQSELQPQASHSTMCRAGCTQEPGSSYSGCQAWVSMSSSQARSAPSEHKSYWFLLVLVLGATWGISNDTELI